MKFFFAIGVVLVVALYLGGCAAVPVDCRVPLPPASLMTVPPSLPTIPSDLTASKRP